MSRVRYIKTASRNQHYVIRSCAYLLTPYYIHIGEGVTPRIEKQGKKGGMCEGAEEGQMEHVHKGRLVKGWRKNDMTRGAERNKREKEGERKTYETPTARGRKKSAPAERKSTSEKRMVKTRDSDDVENGGRNGKERASFL